MRGGFPQLIKMTNDRSPTAIWIGTSEDERQVLQYVQCGLVDYTLVVAHDMDATHGWQQGVECMKVGLVDGPGNPLAAYHAAVLALVALAHRGKVLVCCHDGGRSLAVSIMYLYLIGEGPSWDEAIDRFPSTEIFSRVHETHRKAFFSMDWGMLTRVLEDEVQ
jgi:hypothetical protein